MKLHHDAKIERLKQIHLFRNASKDGLKHLAETADEVTVKAGTEIIGQSHLNHDAYVIVSGSVDVTVDGHKVATIPEGELVGELGLFGHGPASATVTAAEEVTALVIPYNRFDQILDDTPGLAKEIAKELAGRLHAMDAEHAKHPDG